MPPNEMPLFITGGPSREDLFDSVRLSGEARKLVFSLSQAEGTRQAEYHLVGFVKTIGPYESSTSGSWAIRHQPLDVWEIKLETDENDPKIVRLRYDSRCRSGYAWDPSIRKTGRAWFEQMHAEPLSRPAWLDQRMSFEKFLKRHTSISVRWIPEVESDKQSA